MAREHEVPNPVHRQPWGNLARPESNPERADVIVVGLPYDGGVSFRRGAAEGPARLRELSRTADAVTEACEEVRDLELADLGDLVPSGPAHHYFETATARLAALPPDAFVIGLGGDHSVSIPLHRGAAGRWKEPFGIVHIDAHPDLFEVYAGDRLSHACPLRRAAEIPLVGPERIVSLGIRSVAMEEVEYARRSGLRLITARECDRRGLQDVVGETAERLSGLRRVFLDIDIDGLDSSVAPGTGYPTPGGFSARQFLTLLDLLFAALPIQSMALVELAPPLDSNDMTSMMGLTTVLEVLGHVQERKRRRILTATQ
jgi:agmatinase